MSSYFLIGRFYSVDAYAINDFAGIDVGEISDIEDETTNGDASFGAAQFLSRLQEIPGS